MKNTLIVFFLLCLFSCKKEDSTPQYIIIEKVEVYSFDTLHVFQNRTWDTKRTAKEHLPDLFIKITDRTTSTTIWESSVYKDCSPSQTHVFIPASSVKIPFKDAQIEWFINDSDDTNNDNMFDLFYNKFASKPSNLTTAGFFEITGSNIDAKLFLHYEYNL